MTDFTRILIADDNATWLSECLKTLLSDEPHLIIETALTPRVCMAMVANQAYDVVVLDISFTPGGTEGLELIQEVRLASPGSDVIMLSSIDDAETKLLAMNRGAKNYVVKGLTEDVDGIVVGIKSALEKRRRQSRAAAEGILLAASVGATFASQEMGKVFALASEARKETIQNVLITGPTGVGKEVIAKAISGKRDGLPFVTVNCAAIAPSLIESELFGYVRGAFSGAVKDKAGLFEECNGGAIFLDEIAELPAKAQAALLRVAEYGELIRVGSSQVRTVKVRIIAATKEDLDQAVEDKRFRDDLLARLRGIEIRIPPLNERPEDIRPIIEQTIRKSKKPHLKVTQDCIEFLEHHDWPLNVRELVQTINAMILLSASDHLWIGDIPQNILDSIKSKNAKLPASSPTNVREAAYQVSTDASLDIATEIFQRQFLAKKIAEIKGKKTINALAPIVKMPKSTLQRLLKKLDVSLDSQTE